MLLIGSPSQPTRGFYLGPCTFFRRGDGARRARRGFSRSRTGRPTDLARPRRAAVRGGDGIPAWSFGADARRTEAARRRTALCQVPAIRALPPRRRAGLGGGQAAPLDLRSRR